MFSPKRPGAIASIVVAMRAAKAGLTARTPTDAMSWMERVACASPAVTG